MGLHREGVGVSRRSGDLKRKDLASEVLVKLIQIRARFNPIWGNDPKNKQSVTEIGSSGQLKIAVVPRNRRSEARTCQLSKLRKV